MYIVIMVAPDRNVYHLETTQQLRCKEIDGQSMLVVGEEPHMHIPIVYIPGEDRTHKGEHIRFIDLVTDLNQEQKQHLQATGKFLEVPRL